MKNKTIVVGTKNQIWAINPQTRRRIRIKTARDRSEILDIYSNNLGIYHASELIKHEEKVIKEKIKGRNTVKIALFGVNFVQIYDSISRNSVVTLTPPNTENLPLEERLVPIDFIFKIDGNSLLYLLNGHEDIVFPKINGKYKDEDVKLGVEENNIYFNGKNLKSVPQKISYLNAVDSKCFESTFRKKNRNMYEKNKNFFRF